tara:strand:- start:254 stop:547 length:294 start_codon:yes stop_codon:yes gene_type:complete
MGLHKNITSDSVAITLIKKGSNFVASNKMTISNNSDNPATIIVDFFDGTNVFYLVKNLVIPSGVTLVLEDNLKFDSKIYNLRIYNTGTNPDLTVIIK